MTEKQYGGASSHGFKEKISHKAEADKKIPPVKKTEEKNEESNLDENINLKKLKQAGEILKKTKEFAKEIIKKDTSLLELAEKIENKILELGGKPAFPVNLSINEIAAHSTPTYDDTTKASGLLKIDIGVHVDGFVADSAFSIDFENSEENKKLIEAAEAGLKAAVKLINIGVSLRKIGRAIEQGIKAKNFQPIINLSGHSIEKYELHSGVNLPNYDNFKESLIEEGVYAIEPFATSGFGKVRDGKPSGIYVLEKEGNVRDSLARDVLAFIEEEYKTLPFCARWLVKKFGTRALIALKRIEDAGLLHQYPQLIEENRKPVAQAEHTVIITRNEKIVTT
jgi:methionyl aminopeptidase